MSDTEDLIARLRNRSGVQTADVNERVALMDEAADALEKVTAERDGLKVDLETKSIVHECCEKAQERDQLAAVVEQVRDVLTPYPNYGERFAVENVLNAAPFVALDRVKAEAWEEGADATCAAYAIVRTRGYVTNPYRKGESNE